MKSINNLVRARVVSRDRHLYTLEDPETRTTVTQVSVTGSFEYTVSGPHDFPVVGDWVMVDSLSPGGRIHQVLPRKTVLSRKAAGEETVQQVIAANITVLLLVFGLDGGRNFLVRLLERALAVAWNSGARPIVVLNKIDCANPEEREDSLWAARNAAPGADVLGVSALTSEGIAELKSLFQPGDTLGLLGKSGVGKSALVNALGQYQVRTGEQRKADLQGRHTTTSSRLYHLEHDISIIDSPGLRELQIWSDAQDVGSVFEEIREVAQDCRFSDCSHQGEPGCAVQEALNQGYLDWQRYQAYLELMKEQAYLERRQNHRAILEEKQRWKTISKTMKHHRKPGW